MSILKEFSEAQLFFFVFLLLSLPAFLYLYFIAAQETAAPTRNSIEAPPSSKQPQKSDRFLELIPASDHGCNPPAEPQAARLQGKASEWPASGAELPPREKAHPPVAADVVILPLHRPLTVHELEEAAFSQEPGYRVPGGHIFRIVVEIQSLAGELGDEIALPADSGTSDSLVAEIGPGNNVWLLLQCLPGTEDDRPEELPVDVDVAYQAFRLESRPATAIYVARSKPVASAAKARMSLSITSDSAELGTIEFEVTVYPSEEAPA